MHAAAPCWPQPWDHGVVACKGLWGVPGPSPSGSGLDPKDTLDPQVTGRRLYKRSAHMATVDTGASLCGGLIEASTTLNAASGDPSMSPTSLCRPWRDASLVSLRKCQP
jgi:hypothetical protein